MFEKIKNKAITFRKNILVLILVICFIFSPAVRPVQAWDAIPAALMKFGLETVRQVIEGIQRGIVKQAAITALNQEYDYLLTGRSAGGARIVSDYNDYLVRQPQNQANVFINDYISQSIRGRGSLSGYNSAGGEGVGGSYMGRLAIGAKATTSGQPSIVRPTYEGNPSQMFATAAVPAFKFISFRRQQSLGI